LQPIFLCLTLLKSVSYHKLLEWNCMKWRLLYSLKYIWGVTLFKLGLHFFVKNVRDVSSLKNLQCFWNFILVLCSWLVLRMCPKLVKQQNLLGLCSSDWNNLLWSQKEPSSSSSRRDFSSNCFGKICLTFQHWK
jgi:hypothetical protein